MRDGDGWGKQFGSTYNGDSTVIDGTDGEDFFYAWIYGEDAAGTDLDSVKVTLADYTFANNTEDYILDKWVNVDLTSFGFDVSHVYIKMISSDTTGGSINTPTYLAIDNIIVNFPVGLKEVALENVSVYPNIATNVINIKGETGNLVITSMDGKVVYNGEHNEYSQLDITNYLSGIYVIHLVNASGSYTNRFIKE